MSMVLAVEGGMGRWHREGTMAPPGFGPLSPCLEIEVCTKGTGSLWLQVGSASDAARGCSAGFAPGGSSGWRSWRQAAAGKAVTRHLLVWAGC